MRFRLTILMWEAFVCTVVSFGSRIEENLKTIESDSKRSETDSVNRNQQSLTEYEIRMPQVRTKEEDEYLCTSWKIPEDDLFIVKYEALADGATVHHLILNACPDVTQTNNKYWRYCHVPCSRSQILYAWARNAPAFDLPKDVGFHVGKETDLRYLVIQVHYRLPFADDQSNDSSGVRLTVTRERQKYNAGILLMANSQLVIPAHAKGVHGDVSCYYQDDAILYPFAFRTHSHSLGRVISGYVYNGSWHLLGKGNPQWPQAFWPMTSQNVIKRGDGLVARCTYDASDADKDTRMGSMHTDEMCNFYVMYYTLTDAKFRICAGIQVQKLINDIPFDSDTPLPPNPLLDGMAMGDHAHLDSMDSGIKIKPFFRNNFDALPSRRDGSKYRNVPLSDDREPVDSMKRADSRVPTAYHKEPEYMKKPVDNREPVDNLESVREKEPAYNNMELEYNRNPSYDREPAYSMELGSRRRPAYDEQLGDGVRRGRWRGLVVLGGKGEGESDRDEDEVMRQQYRNRHPFADAANRKIVVDSNDDRNIVERMTTTPSSAASIPEDFSITTSQSFFLSTSERIVIEKKSHQRKLNVDDSWMLKMSSNGMTLGQISGVATDVNDDVYVFHRGRNVWNEESFDPDNKFNDRKKGPIAENTLIKFSGINGDVIRQWGSQMFYLPHGLHVDCDGNIWVTDVALHQVMKFNKSWSDGSAAVGPELVLGVEFEPGSDDAHFCKPTDVAVLQSGEIFVSDGYCNSRILKFSKDGRLIRKWGERSQSLLPDGYPPTSTFDIPHSVVALDDRSLICVADRENARIECFDYDGKFINQMNLQQFKPKLYAVTYSKTSGYLYTITGPSMNADNLTFHGNTIDMNNCSVINTWKPNSSGFKFPHDIAVSLDGSVVYAVEIGPNKIWKFKTSDSDSHQSVKKAGVNNYHQHPLSESEDDDVIREEEEEKEVDEKVNKDDEYFGATLIIGGLIIVPLLLMVAILVVLRLRHRGKTSAGSAQNHNRRFNLGSLLVGGTKKLDLSTDYDERRMELRHLQSDSEVDEFIAPHQQNA